MSTATFKFDSLEEQAAFSRLISLIPRIQGWDDTNHCDIDTLHPCHICNSALVKSGVVPFDDFFESERLEGYTFWRCCQSCHNQGWQIPERFFKGGLKYWRINPEQNHKYEELVITNFQIFKFPSVMLVNLDTVLVTI